MKKHYQPISEMVNFSIKRIEKLGVKEPRVLEIGPGVIQFSRATHYVGHDEDACFVRDKSIKYLNIQKLPNFYTVDIDEEKLPFPDKYFDFVYCRHVLEDIQNPNFAFKEMTRVGKNGHIECPSPMVEITRFIDAGDDFYRGFAHHRYFVYNDKRPLHENVLTFLPKYPMIEHYSFESCQKLLNEEWNWNTYYTWDENTVPNCKMLKNERDFRMVDESYRICVVDAVNAGYNNSLAMKDIVSVYGK